MRFFKVVPFIIVFLGWFVSAAVAETIKFPGWADVDNPIELTAKILKPDGEGPFPAIVLLHGGSGLSPEFASGLTSVYDEWAARFVKWGYVALIVDSFGPRGVKTVTDDIFRVSFVTRSDDAFAAKKYLAGLNYVNKDRIFVVGWSHGGIAVIEALLDHPYIDRGDPFRAAIAFSPYCMKSLSRVNAPFMILIGELDDWCPADNCLRCAPQKKTENEVTVKVYPGAHHCFCWKGLNTDYNGHHLEYNPEAAADSIIQVKAFFEKYN